VPSNRQDPLLRQLNPQSSSSAASDSGLSVSRYRQDPLLRQLNPQSSSHDDIGLGVPSNRQDPLLRGLAPSQHDDSRLALEVPQVTARKVIKDDDSLSASNAGGRKKDPLSSSLAAAGVEDGRFANSLEPPPDLATIFGTGDQLSGSNGGAAEKLRLSPEPGTSEYTCKKLISLFQRQKTNLSTILATCLMLMYCNIAGKKVSKFLRV